LLFHVFFLDAVPLPRSKALVAQEPICRTPDDDVGLIFCFFPPSFIALFSPLSPHWLICLVAVILTEVFRPLSRGRYDGRIKFVFFNPR